MVHNIFKGYKKSACQIAKQYNITFIAHPIGVGMLSDEQFEEWINEAKNITKTYKTIIIETSHADGSFRNCRISIPIS